MATTPNYHWPTPDDVRQFKNGALDTRTLGNAIDATVKSLDAADATWRAGYGAHVYRSATQATSASSNDAVFVFDTTIDQRGGAYGGTGGIVLATAGLYVITGWADLGVGTGGILQIAVKTSAGSNIGVAASCTRTPNFRAVAVGTITTPIAGGTTLQLRYSTDTAMTIGQARLSAYRVSNY